MNGKNPKVDGYFKKAGQWREESEKLRTLLLGCGLAEELKWGKPCYQFQKSNVVIIQGFKAYCALLFFKGVLLKDPDRILIKTGANTHVGRQIRFTHVREIVRLGAILKAYIHQAIEVEKAGLKVEPPKNTDLALPEESKSKFKARPALKKAFEALTLTAKGLHLLFFRGQTTSANARAARKSENVCGKFSKERD